MRYLFLYTLFFFPGQGLEAFTGAGSTEATMEFEHFVEFPLTDASVQPTKAQILELIHSQVEHLVGPMARVPLKSAPKGDGQVDPMSLRKELKKNEKGEVTHLKVYYRYQGTVIVANGAKTPYQLYLPLNPLETYQKALGASPKNPCTDDHYYGYGDFWYFWHPLRPRCRDYINEGVDYHKVFTKLTRKPNATNSTKKTYPEYGKLSQNGVIKIMLLMGMDDGSNHYNPIESENRADDDLNAENFRIIRNTLMDPRGLGLKARRWQGHEIRSLMLENTNPLPYVESFVEEYPAQNTRAQRLEVVMFFGKAGRDENSKAFHYFLREAFKNYSIVIYDGHSGLGDHLYLKGIERDRNRALQRLIDEGLVAPMTKFKFVATKDKYQIFYFNSCSSYTYYTSDFFPQKRSARDPNGTKFLDIVGTGLETGFEGGPRTNLELITTVRNFAKLGTVKSFVELLKRLESDNLSGVIGDEDNPTTQAEAKKAYR